VTRSVRTLLLLAALSAVAGCSLDFDEFPARKSGQHDPSDGGENDSGVGHAGDPCADEGSRTCDGHASRQPLVCERGTWVTAARCASDQRCDSRSGSTEGKCVAIPPECEDRTAEARFCIDDMLRECDVDLVSFEDLACGEFGSCEKSADGAQCVCMSGHTRDADGACNDRGDAGADDGNAGKGGGGHGGSGPTNEAPEVKVDFPPAGVTDRSSIRVRGHVSDSEGDAISELTVNGKSAKVDKHGAFSVDAPLKLGRHALALHVEDEAGSKADIKASPIERLGYMFQAAGDMVLDSANDRVIALDQGNDAVVAIALSDGTRTLIAPPSDMPAGRQSLALDSANDRVLVAEVDAGRLTWVDLTSGESTPIPDGAPAIVPIAVTLDPNDANRAFVISRGSPDAIYAVDLTSGSHTLLDGTALGSCSDLAYDAANARLIVASTNGALTAVNATTGARTPISNPQTSLGNGPDWGSPWQIAIDGDRALVFATEVSAIFEADLDTGDRAELAGLTLGSDPQGLALNQYYTFVFDPASGEVLALDPGGRLVSARLEPGSRETFSNGLYGTGPLFSEPISVAFDPNRSRWIVADVALHGVFAVDPLGARSVVSDNASDGPDFGELTAIAVDAVDDEILALDESHLFSVDPVSGAHTLIATEDDGKGPSFKGSWDMVSAQGGGRVLVIGCYGDPCDYQVLAIDLSTGTRTLISGTGKGTGPAFGALRAIDGYSDQSVIVSTDDALFDVNPSNGTRKIISNSTTGTGPALDLPQTLSVDRNLNRALLINHFAVPRALLAIDLTSGQRTELASEDRGDGEFPNFISDAAYDQSQQQLQMAEGWNEATAGLVAIDLADRKRDLVSDQAAIERWDATALALDPDSGLLYAARSGLFTNASSPNPGASLLSLDPRTGKLKTISDEIVDATMQRWKALTGLALDAENHRMLGLVSTNDSSALLAFDLDDGTQSLIADATTGSGLAWTQPADVAWDAAHERSVLGVWLLPALVAVDADGERATLSGGPTGSGEIFGAQTLSFTLDVAGNRALVAEQTLIREVDLDSGDRKVFSGDGFGDGPLPARAARAVIDEAGERAIVLDVSYNGPPQQLMAIALSDGERSVLTELPPAWFAPTFFPQLLAFDSATQVAYVGSSVGAGLFAIDPSSGQHILVAGYGK
jgi:hypothetical protein